MLDLCLLHVRFGAPWSVEAAVQYRVLPDVLVSNCWSLQQRVQRATPFAGAVRTCVRAGIRVRMVTGDNIHTAQHIARDCGILDESTGGFAMEGPEFRNTPRDEMMKRLPQLQVRYPLSWGPSAMLTLLVCSSGPGTHVHVKLRCICARVRTPTHQVRDHQCWAHQFRALTHQFEALSLPGILDISCVNHRLSCLGLHGGGAHCPGVSVPAFRT